MSAFEATSQRLDDPFTIPPAVAAVLFSGEWFHGARTSLILTSVNSVSLSAHIVSSAAVCSLYVCFFS